MKPGIHLKISVRSASATNKRHARNDGGGVTFEVTPAPEGYTCRSITTSSMLLPILRRAPAAARGFSSIKRAKPIRVKKSEARRAVPEAPKPTDALTEAPAPPPPANPFVQSEQQAPRTFGGVMKESFLWGMGMAVAFSVVGIIFSSMEETTSPDEFEGSFVMPEQQKEDQQ